MGKYQFDTLRAAVSNLDTIQTAYNESLNSMGTTQEKIGPQMNTLAADLQRLHDAIQTMGNNAGQGALGDFLKTLVNDVTTLIEGIQKLPPNVDKTIAALAGLLLAGKAVSAVSSTFKGILEGVVNGLKFYKGVADVAAKSTVTVAESAMNAASAMTETAKATATSTGAMTGLRHGVNALTADLNGGITAIKNQMSAEAESNVVKDAEITKLNQQQTLFPRINSLRNETTTAVNAETDAMGTLTVAEEAENIATQTATKSLITFDTAAAGLSMGLTVLIPIVVALAMNLGQQAQATQDLTQKEQDAVNLTQQLTDQQQQQVTQSAQNINSLQDLKQRYVDAQKAMQDNVAGSQKYQNAQNTMMDIERQLIGLVGQRAASQILSSNDVVGAINNEKSHIAAVQVTDDQATVDMIQNQQKKTQQVIDQTTQRIHAYQAEADAIASLAQMQADAASATVSGNNVGAQAASSLLSTLNQNKSNADKTQINNLQKLLEGYNKDKATEAANLKKAQDQLAADKILQQQIAKDPNATVKGVGDGGTADAGPPPPKTKAKAGPKGPSQSTLDNSALAPYTQQNDMTTFLMREAKDNMGIAQAQLKENPFDTTALTNFTNAYKAQIAAIKQHSSGLADEDTKIQQLLSHLSPSSAEYSRLTKQLYDNKDAIAQDSLQIYQLKDAWQQQNLSIMNTQFKDATDRNSFALRDFANQIKVTAKDITDLDKVLSSDESALSKNYTSISDAQKVLQDYDKVVDAHKQHIQELQDENTNLSKQQDATQQEIDKISAAYKNGDISYQDYISTLQQLDSTYDNLTSTIDQNKQAIQSDTDAITSANQKIRDQIVADLKSAYTQEENTQLKEMQNQYDASKQSIEDQKTALDQLIQSIQQQNQALSEQNKLTDLQNQLNQVMSERNQEIIGQNGQITYTYDVTKADGLQKQIADEQLKIQQQNQLDSLNQQKTYLSQQETDLTNSYNNDVKAVKDMWSKRLTTDSLNQEADYLIQQYGQSAALELTTEFSSQMQNQYQQITNAVNDTYDAIQRLKSVYGITVTLPPLPTSVPTPTATSTPSSTSLSNQPVTVVFQGTNIQLPNVKSGQDFINEMSQLGQHAYFYGKAQ